MQYEPTRRLSKFSSETEWLMLPFAEAPDDDNGELIGIIATVLGTLSEQDQQALHGIFYEQKTYQELAEDLGIKAKSHAWRRVTAALDRLKAALYADETFRQLVKERYGISDLG